MGPNKALEVSIAKEKKKTNIQPIFDIVEKEKKSPVVSLFICDSVLSVN